MLSMIIDNISSFMYSKLLVIILIGAGVYFTIRTSFPQVRLFHSACKAVMEKPDDEDVVSSFQALVSTASRVGTGNMVGVSSAICIGVIDTLLLCTATAMMCMSSGVAPSESTSGSTMGTGRTSGIAWNIRAGIHHRVYGIICIYDTAW